MERCKKCGNVLTIKRDKDGEIIEISCNECGYDVT